MDTQSHAQQWVSHTWIFDEGTKFDRGNSPFNKWSQSNWRATCRENIKEKNLKPNLTPETKLTQNRAQTFSKTSNNTTFRGKETGENLHDRGLANSSQNHTPHPREEKPKSQTSLRFKTFALPKSLL